MVDILENAEKVCTTWNKICKDPAMWRVINMNDLLVSDEELTVEKVCKHVVDRSQGHLVDITVVLQNDDELLLYVADRSSQLKCLKIESRYTSGIHVNLLRALMKFLLLEELSLHPINISKEAIETAGSHCPQLKVLKVNEAASAFWKRDANEGSMMLDNEIAIAIGENLHELKHLELIGCVMSNIGLRAILDGCRHLETLDLRKCLNVDLKGDLGLGKRGTN